VEVVVTVTAAVMATMAERKKKKKNPDTPMVAQVVMATTENLSPIMGTTMVEKVVTETTTKGLRETSKLKMKGCRRPLTKPNKAPLFRIYRTAKVKKSK
jgi:hypothetical protein